jgi:hypothetical protein
MVKLSKWIHQSIKRMQDYTQKSPFLNGGKKAAAIGSLEEKCADIPTFVTTFIKGFGCA